MTGPTTIVVRARQFNAAGQATNAQIFADGNGSTSLRYLEVFP